MELTAKQQAALKLAVDRYRAGDKYTCISGYAGSGKTTIIRFIIDSLGLDPEQEVCYIALTGKAATVLKSKGCANAMTAHKLLYQAKPLPDGTYFFEEREQLDKDYKVVVVDEVSMLSKTMWELLLTHPVYVIAAGDPEQLPPIDPTEDNKVLEHPHIFLDEVLRQAQESEIIRLSMHIRQGLPIYNFPCKNEEVRVFKPNQLSLGMLNWADQVLCATNAKRNEINNIMREAKGFGPEPEIGDKIIALSNKWEFSSQSGDWSLTNGCIGEITEFYRHTFTLPKYITNEPVEYMFTDMIFEEDKFCNIPIDYKFLTGNEPALNPKQAHQLKKNKKIELTPPYDFAYAYAITTWKAQGSQWDKVLGLEEKFPYDQSTHRKFLYTMCTRAAKKLVIITKN